MSDTVLVTFVIISFLFHNSVRKREKGSVKSSGLFKATKNPNRCRPQLLPSNRSYLLPGALGSTCLPLRERPHLETGTQRDEKMVHGSQVSCGMRQQHRSPSPPAQGGFLDPRWVQGPAVSSRALRTFPFRVFLTVPCDRLFVVHLP